MTVSIFWALASLVVGWIAGRYRKTPTVPPVVNEMAATVRAAPPRADLDALLDEHLWAKGRVQATDQKIAALVEGAKKGE